MIEKYIPLKRKENEPNLEESELNKERIKYYKLEEYQSNEKFEEMTRLKLQEVHNTFSEIFKEINNLKNKEDYDKTEDDLQVEIKALYEDNKKQVEDLAKVIENIGILCCMIITKEKKGGELDMCRTKLNFTNN